MCAKLFSPRDTWYTLASVDEGAHKCPVFSDNGNYIIKQTIHTYIYIYYIDLYVHLRGNERKG